MTDTNRELVPDNWNLIRERALTARFLFGRHFEHSCVCRRAELPGRRVKVEKLRKVDNRYRLQVSAGGRLSLRGCVSTKNP